MVRPYDGSFFLMWDGGTLSVNDMELEMVLLLDCVPFDERLLYQKLSVDHVWLKCQHDLFSQIA